MRGVLVICARVVFGFSLLLRLKEVLWEGGLLRGGGGALPNRCFKLSALYEIAKLLRCSRKESVMLKCESLGGDRL